MLEEERGSPCFTLLRILVRKPSQYLISVDILGYMFLITLDKQLSTPFVFQVPCTLSNTLLMSITSK